ncbi:UDP-2,3-diacylglucosamine diphosphatase [Pannonibacter sp. Q-1]|uniref:UDP-2,3-diacylglucosamine hydrolase n=1 Tax=Pannonibacter phragmitetus TaxID=121719 RepID=A0A0U3P5S1_9HYPH|nr:MULTISPECIES: UDP-2,3-diacylglucosamine diphosphatase [Pannonibacter]ALV28178.1 UDP-2,3-diacylglucosamine hydrolase [Pannonibacter phragmitetus]MBA4203984.1 UDP-2,3-diacylglucosamine diphosphatase [Polymorphum sp.]
MTALQEGQHYRALFISDVHLGTRGCQADLLLDFLKYNDAETVYLVGDIVDGWRLKRSWYWPQAHNDVIQKILRKARKGARIFYIPGNHDEFLRDFLGTHFGGVEVADSVVHTAADGREYLVIHGDQFDVVIRHAKWLAFFGDKAYVTALALNTGFNLVRRRLGLTYWSLSAWAKLKVKNAVNFIGRFEDALSDEARRKGVHGVICGHIHHAASHDIDGIHYINTGDWVESCTAVAEHHDGTFEVIRWVQRPAEQQAEQGMGERSVAA